VAFALSPVTCLIGWLVGVALLWTSKVWTTRHKVIGTIATLPLCAVLFAAPALLVTTGRTTTSSQHGAITVQSAPVQGPTTTVDHPLATAPAPSLPSDTATSSGGGTDLAGVAAIVAALLVFLVLPIGTLIWLGRALSTVARRSAEPVP